jgi:lysophospholipase L1-like esterase
MTPRSHVVLLGDSILDNAAYVRGGPDVVAQLGTLLPAGWRATLAAVDGAVIADVPRQLARVPADATHLVVSAGGNDALRHADLLERRASSSPEVLGWLADAASAFRERYRAMLTAVLARGLPVTLCTIYEGNLGPPVQRAAATALAVFNDAILRAAVEHRVDVIELRLVCTEPADYANPIEPSVRGGAKIARAIAGAVGAVPSGGSGARLLAG